MTAGFPGFGSPQRRQEPPRVPHSHECGDVAVPWNIGRNVFRFRAPASLTIKDVAIFCGSVESPSGHPVVLEAWKNGQYGGDVQLVSGANKFDRALPLAPMDLVELRACVKGTGDAETVVRDLWIMFTT